MTPSSMSIWLRLPLIKLFLSERNKNSETKKVSSPSRIEVIEMWTLPILKPIRKFLILFSRISTETPQAASKKNRAIRDRTGFRISANQKLALTRVRGFILKVLTQKRKLSNLRKNTRNSL